MNNLPADRAHQPTKAERGLVLTFLAQYDQLLQRLETLLRNREDARDALQNAFVKCWERRAHLGRVTHLPAWFCRVSLNAGRDLMRDAWRRRARPLEAASPPERTTSPVEILAERERQAGLQAAVENLRPEEREVFVLRKEGHQRWEEIARQCRRPVGTVKTQMRAAVHKLRQMLEGTDRSRA